MIASRLGVAFLCLCVAGCGGGCGGSAEPAQDEQATGEASGGETPGEPGAEPEPPVNPGPAPTLRVVGEPDAHSRAVAIRIENRGEAAELAGAVTVQRLAGEVFTDVSPLSLQLRYSCEEEAPECVTLAPGATYLPPEWLGTMGDAQCACERCAAAESGTYRFVVRTCNRAHAVEGEPFELH